MRADTHHTQIDSTVVLMPEYRRFREAGGCYFFTVVTHGRGPILATELGRACLREAILRLREQRPFRIVASVLLPDHLHMIWGMPRGDADYSVRWRRIKEHFTKLFLRSGGPEQAVSDSRLLRAERGVWQRRYWEHAIRDDLDLERHADYIHYNPVKHSLVECPGDWPYSSFHRWVAGGSYAREWGCSSQGIRTFDDLDESAME